jgi:SAM-dependent methyltransferase
MKSAIGAVLYRLSEWFHEARFGVKTAGLITPKGSEYDEGECYPYLPISYRALAKVFREIKITPDKDSFIDYGSGLGRVPLFAAQFPFRRVIGVELATELHDGAVENRRRALKKLRCKSVDFINVNALDYALPHDVTVVYFFMPFGPEILAKVMKNIHESVLEVPRKLQIIYLNPTGKFSITAIAKDLPWLTLVESKSLSAHYELVTATIVPEELPQAAPAENRKVWPRQATGRLTKRPRRLVRQPNPL